MINHCLYAHIGAVSAIFYCYMLQSKQSDRHLLCSVMSHLVFFAYQIMFNILL